MSLAEHPGAGYDRSLPCHRHRSAGGRLRRTRRRASPEAGNRTKLRHVLPLVLLAVIAGCGQGAPTSPSGDANQQTRILGTTGALGFGTVAIGEEASRTVTLVNQGNAPLTVSRFSGSDLDVMTLSWSGGTIPAGASQAVEVLFRPLEARFYGGGLVVVSDKTAGGGMIPYTGEGIRTGPPWTGPLWTITGTGPAVFEMPSHVVVVRIQTAFGDFCESFDVRVASRHLVNVILGTCGFADVSTYDGTHVVTGGGKTEVSYAQGVTWTFTEVR